MTNEIISKVNNELKAQGINATEAQIKSAVNEVISKQELNENALENVAGGFNPAVIVPFIPTIIDTVKKVTGGGKKEDKKDGGGTPQNTTPGITQTNTNTKTNQQNNVSGSNTMQNNTITFS